MMLAEQGIFGGVLNDVGRTKDICFYRVERFSYGCTRGSVNMKSEYPMTTVDLFLARFSLGKLLGFCEKGIKLFTKCYI